ncbi:MAG: hypothetical protein MZW92_45755 [Comamonadaceae bacterium]|nr:hypothetical protein [Comamonadaceae bacterium]
MLTAVAGPGAGLAGACGGLGAAGVGLACGFDAGCLAGRGAATAGLGCCGFGVELGPQRVAQGVDLGTLLVEIGRQRLRDFLGELSGCCAIPVVRFFDEPVGGARRLRGLPRARGQVVFVEFFVAQRGLFRR